MTEVLNIQVFLENIRSNDKFREEFSNIAKDIKSDVISFLDNPKCGCRRSIYKYIESNKDKYPLSDFISNWKPIIKDLYAVMTPDQSGSNATGLVEGIHSQVDTQPPRKIMAGHVVEILPIPDEYKKLIDHAKKDFWMFRGLSVKDSINKEGRPVWLVFFF